MPATATARSVLSSDSARCGSSRRKSRSNGLAARSVAERAMIDPLLPAPPADQGLRVPGGVVAAGHRPARPPRSAADATSGYDGVSLPGSSSSNWSPATGSSASSSTRAVGGVITKARGGGEAAGRSLVDRGKQGLQSSGMTDAYGIPLGRVLAGVNCHGSPLLAPTRTPLAPRSERGLHGRIAHKGEKAPIQASRRWHVERTHAWQNAFCRLAGCYECRVTSSMPPSTSPTPSSPCAP